MNYASLIDFGSTFTKMTVVSIKEQKLLFTTKTPSTVKSDASVGMEICLWAAKKFLGSKMFAQCRQVACSSAAGGLRMVVVGLTPTLSMVAGKNAALGAGARVIQSYSHILTLEDVAEINAIKPEIILLCGGVNGGNTDRVIWNASLLADHCNGDATIVFAGNQEVAETVRLLFRHARQECVVAKNIFPVLGTLEAEPAAEVIRGVFMNRIVDLKGLNKVRRQVKDIIMPTPMAVLEAGKLLAKGTGSEHGLGELMIVDIGGATTDIHSFGDTQCSAEVRITGAPEPYAKRTVEGDLGLRSSAQSLWEEIEGSFVVKKLGKSKASFSRSIMRRTNETEFLPETIIEQRLDRLLSEECARLAARRHAGNRSSAYCGGAQIIQKGKNLRGVTHIVGTGGPIVNSEAPVSILKTVLVEKRVEPDVLLPEKAKFMLDQQYILYAMGLLSKFEPTCALKILREELAVLDEAN